MGEERAFLPAVVSPAAAYLIAEALGPAIERLAQRQRMDWLRRDVRRGLASMRESGRQWVDRSAVGDPVEGVEASAEEMTVGEAAQLLDVSPEMVRRVAEERLGGRRVGRTWRLDAVAVRLYAVERRRRAAS